MFTYSNLVCTQLEFKAEQNHPFQEFNIVVLLYTELVDHRNCSRKKYKTVEENNLVKKNHFSLNAFFITIKIDPTLLLRRVLHKLR